MAEPDIVTQAQTPVTVGETITDTATLSGGYNPTGVITFKAYLDAACTEPAAFTGAGCVDGNDDYTSAAVHDDRDRHGLLDRLLRW